MPIPPGEVNGDVLSRTSDKYEGCCCNHCQGLSVHMAKPCDQSHYGKYQSVSFYLHPNFFMFKANHKETNFHKITDKNYLATGNCPNNFMSILIGVQQNLTQMMKTIIFVLFSWLFSRIVALVHNRYLMLQNLADHQ